MWTLLEPHLPDRKGSSGRNAKDNRKFINAVIWILRTKAPCRDLPPEYVDSKNTHRRFSRWRDKCIWAKLFNMFVQDPDFEWLMIDSSCIKVHPHTTGASGGNQDMGRTKGYLTQRYTLQ